MRTILETKKPFPLSVWRPNGKGFTNNQPTHLGLPEYAYYSTFGNSEPDISGRNLLDDLEK